MDKDILLFLQEGTLWSGVLSFLLMMVLAFIPAMPIPVVASAIGAVFGFWPAFLISWGGAVAGALLMFILSRFLFRNKAYGMIKKYKKADALLHFIENNAFLSLLIVRLLPIFPSAVINLGAALSGIKMRTFLLAALLGKLPAMLTFTLAGNQLEKGNWPILVLVGLYLLVILLAAARIRKVIGQR
ncbi:TVP38/TMEM64 family protein [Actinomycetes bacterium NPDC127524]